MWGFFYVARMDEVFTHPTPGAPYIPRRWRPQPQRTRTACTSQAARQAAPDAGQTTQGTTHTPKRWTRCTGLHSIPDRPRLDDRTGCGVLDYLYNVSETEQIRTIERHTKTGLKIITFSCMFVACATLQIH